MSKKTWIDGQLALIGAALDYCSIVDAQNQLNAGMKDARKLLQAAWDAAPENIRGPAKEIIDEARRARRVSTHKAFQIATQIAGGIIEMAQAGLLDDLVAIEAMTRQNREKPILW